MKKIRIDAGKCTGCRVCEVICSLVHDGKDTINPRKARIRVFKDDEEGVNLPLIARSPNQVEYVTVPQLTLEGKKCNLFQFWTLFKSAELECNVCTSCVKWCATGALTLVEQS